jgi:hypothetical protein
MIDINAKYMSTNPNDSSIILRSIYRVTCGFILDKIKVLFMKVSTVKEESSATSVKNQQSLELFIKPSQLSMSNNP